MAVSLLLMQHSILQSMVHIKIGQLKFDIDSIHEIYIGNKKLYLDVITKLK